MKNLYQKEIYTSQGIRYLDFLNKCISLKPDNSNIDYFFKKLEYYNNQVQEYTIDIIPTYKCNLKCEYCYSRETRINMKPENTEYVKSQLIINTIKKRVNNKPINLGFIGGGEPLIEKKLILNIISNIKPIKFLSITTNGLLLDEEFFQQLHSFDNVDKIFWNISINYINFDFILKNIRELKEIFRGEKIFLLIYINDKYDIILLKRGIKELLSYNMFIIKIKPIILDGVIQSHDEYYSIVKYFIQVAKNNTIFDFMENCTNLRLQSYFAIDCFGRIYKCHAQAGLTKGCSEDKPYEYGICIHCCYFPICLGGCFPYGDRPFDQNSCAFFNHITTIINIYLNQFKLVDIKGI